MIKYTKQKGMIVVKKFIKMLFIITIFCAIVVMLILIGLYTKKGIRNIAILKDYVKEIETERLELTNNEYVLEMTEKTQLPLVIEKPAKGTQFGTLKIPSIGVELAIMNGTTKNLLSQGVGYDSESYLPGEGGSIILMGHNFKQFLARLPDTKTGDEVIIETTYGEFHYTIYDAKVVKETAVNEVPIQKDEEIVMIYTCWPIPNITHANDRYVIYAK